jgi:hypothetical protein
MTSSENTQQESHIIYATHFGGKYVPDENDKQNNPGSQVMIIRYPGEPRFIGGTITYENGITTHSFYSSTAFEPIRKTTLATRLGCKTLAILEHLNLVPRLPAIQNWWSAHKASDAARGIRSGGGGC